MDELIHNLSGAKRESFSQSQINLNAEKETKPDDSGILRLFVRICGMDPSLIKQYIIGATFACCE